MLIVQSMGRTAADVWKTLQEAMGDKKLTPARLSKKLGRNAGYLREFGTGKKKTLGARESDLLASILEIDRGLLSIEDPMCGERLKHGGMLEPSDSVELIEAMVRMAVSLERHHYRWKDSDFRTVAELSEELFLRNRSSAKDVETRRKLLELDILLALQKGTL